MALYFYQALTKAGKKTSGYLDASSANTVKEQLVSKGMYPISINLAASAAQKNFFQRLFTRKVSTKDKILFTKQLAVLLKSGVPILQAFEILSGYFTGQLESILITVKDEIKEGQSLADALAKYPAVFDNIYVQLVRAGEASGKLDAILERLTEDIEKQEELKATIIDAIRGPMIQLVGVVLITMFLLIGVVPGLTDVFTAEDKELSWNTELLIKLSYAARTYYIFIAVAILVIITALRYFASTTTGARKIDEFKLKIPIIKEFTRLGAIVQFCRTLSMLLEAGVSLSVALDIVVKIVDNRVLADALYAARDKIVKQGKIAQYLQETKIFPPIAIYLINTGEQSGQLDTMLLTIAQNYEQDLNEYAKNLTATLGPIIMLFMAVVVGFVVISIAVPMMDMGDINLNP